MTELHEQQRQVRPTSAWQLILRAAEVRFRFLILLGLMAALMTLWPWMRAGWDTLASAWHRPASATVSPDTEYFCPMDPGIVSAWPAICPICNMDLITRKKTDAVLLPEGVVARMQLSPYRVQLAGIRTEPVKELSEPSDGTTSSNPSHPPLTVPISAVVHHGEQAVVYVESMPGMFDGIIVQLGGRMGELYAIQEGLKPGQRVVTAGSFLVDAESRLHSNAATQYFGATSTSRQPELPKRRVESKSAQPLSEADQELVKKQRICPVTEAPLGSMGTPVFAMVQGRKVFMCCRGCEAGLLANPEKYLKRLETESEKTSPEK